MDVTFNTLRHLYNDYQSDFSSMKEFSSYLGTTIEVACDIVSVGRVLHALQNGSKEAAKAVRCAAFQNALKRISAADITLTI